MLPLRSLSRFVVQAIGSLNRSRLRRTRLTEGYSYKLQKEGRQEPALHLLLLRKAGGSLPYTYWKPERAKITENPAHRGVFLQTSKGRQAGACPTLTPNARPGLAGRTFQLKSVKGPSNAAKKIWQAYKSAKQHEYIDVDVYIGLANGTADDVVAAYARRAAEFPGSSGPLSGPWIANVFIKSGGTFTKIVLPR